MSLRKKVKVSENEMEANINTRRGSSLGIGLVYNELVGSSPSLAGKISQTLWSPQYR
jgi:hypothetical protein